MNPRGFSRDLLVLLATIVLLAVYSFIGFIHWYMALLYLMLYIMFVVYVIRGELIRKIAPDTNQEIVSDPTKKQLKNRVEFKNSLSLRGENKISWKDGVNDIFASTYFIPEYKEMSWIGKLFFFLLVVILSYFLNYQSLPTIKINGIKDLPYYFQFLAGY